MIKITYRNELGAVVFGEFPINLLKTDGLTLPEKSFSAYLFSDGNGQHTYSSAALARHITLTADIYTEKRTGDISKMLGILNKKGTLEIFSEYRKRKIEAYMNTFVLNERHGNYQCFTVQFTCDFPYFTDIFTKCLAVYERADISVSEFTLPQVMTKRTSTSNVILGGELECEPIIRIYCNSAAQSEGSGIEVNNITNGNFIKLNYDISVGEEVVIDVKNRKIYNSAGESLINCISEDTFLSDFKLEPGENVIEIKNSENVEGISVIMEYGNLYAEAVI